MNQYKICVTLNGYATVEAEDMKSALEHARDHLTLEDFSFEPFNDDVLADAIAIQDDIDHPEDDGSAELVEAC